MHRYYRGRKRYRGQINHVVPLNPAVVGARMEYDFLHMPPENSDHPELVYHYTTMGTMMKIVESGCIWATSINYLNDTTEGDYFQQLVRERIPQYRCIHHIDDPELFDEFLNASPQDVISRPFVASFSQDGDSLSQWRSYCPSGNGVAIGFRVDCLRRASVKAIEPLLASLSSSPDKLRFVRVDYLDGQTTESLDTAIFDAVRFAKGGKASSLTPARRFKLVMQFMACARKHFSFSNEREYRLIVHAVYDANWMEFRPVRSTLVPYVPVSIPRKRASKSAPVDTEEDEQAVTSLDLVRVFGNILESLRGADFISRVVIGPSPNVDLSRAAVDLFFQKHKMKVEVVSSAIPYRDW